MCCQNENIKYNTCIQKTPHYRSKMQLDVSPSSIVSWLWSLENETHVITSQNVDVMQQRDSFFFEKKKIFKKKKKEKSCLKHFTHFYYPFLILQKYLYNILYSSTVLFFHVLRNWWMITTVKWGLIGFMQSIGLIQ